MIQQAAQWWATHWFKVDWRQAWIAWKAYHSLSRRPAFDQAGIMAWTWRPKCWKKGSNPWAPARGDSRVEPWLDHAGMDGEYDLSPCWWWRWMPEEFWNPLAQDAMAASKQVWGDFKWS